MACCGYAVKEFYLRTKWVYMSLLIIKINKLNSVWITIFQKNIFKRRKLLTVVVGGY